MPDRYLALTSSRLGPLLTKVGLPSPTPLQRYVDGEPLLPGPVRVVGRGRLREAALGLLAELGAPNRTGEATHGVVFDATGLASPEELVELRDELVASVSQLRDNGRVIVLGTQPEQVAGDERIAQRALEGFTRSLAKEIGRAITVNLVLVGASSQVDDARSTLGFLLSARSAYVTGQVVSVGVSHPHHAEETGGRRRTALVTGASRGIGAEIAKVLARSGHHVVGVDVPAAHSALVATLAPIFGEALALDITAADADEQLVAHARAVGGYDVVVHNAGITRDRRFKNLLPREGSEDRWRSVFAVNVVAPRDLTAALLAAGQIRPNGRIVALSSVAGLAGNVGQTNYAASKAAVVGWIEELAQREAVHAAGITANAVAPGFIVTDMTAAVPVITREVGQRLNSLHQGGLPVDVAETVNWLAEPDSGAVSGQVVRVCGQMAIGA